MGGLPVRMSTSRAGESRPAGTGGAIPSGRDTIRRTTRVRLGVTGEPVAVYGAGRPAALAVTVRSSRRRRLNWPPGVKERILADEDDVLLMLLGFEDR